MRQIYAIAKAELRVLFFSPIAWLIIIIFSFQASASFAKLIETMASKQELSGFASDITKEIFTGFGAIYLVIQNNLYLYIPLLTMGLMSREYSSGSIKLLYSSPLGGVKVIFGKFLSIAAFAVVMMGTVIPLILFTVFKVESADLSFMLSGLLGLTLLFLAYAAVGLYMSTLSSYQVVVAMLTLGVLALLSNLGSIGQEIELVREVTNWLSLKGRASTFVGGLITSRDIMYFLIVIGIFLSLSVIKLNSGRSKESISRAISKYVGVVAVAAMLAYFSSAPGMILYYDATQIKANTITKNTQDILKKLDGSLKIKTYVNMADMNFVYGIPRLVIMDRDRFEEYKRFLPGIKMEYVYYYDEPYKNRDYKEGITSAEDIARKYTEPYGIDFNKLLTPAKIKEQINLKPELNTFVRILESKDGKTAFLRIFDDIAKHPNETEVAGALLKLVDTVPQILFLYGSGEPSISRYGDADLTKFATERSNRSALINQGYYVTSANLKNSSYQMLKDSSDILVLVDPKEPITGDNLEKILTYIEEGGNMLIATEPGRTQNIMPIAEELGITFLPGVLVSPNQDFVPTLISSQVSHLSFDLSRFFRALGGSIVTTPTAVGLDFVLGNKFEVIPVTSTARRGAWNEVETTDFLTGEISYNRSAGERQRMIPTSFALSRMVGDKEQRIFFIGDSDCLSNGELGANRKGLDAENGFFIRGIFNWLSYNKLPVDVRHEFPKDNKIFVTMEQAKSWKVALSWAIPLLMALIGALILYYRKRW